MGTTLVINPGSSSKKYALYHNGQAVLDMAFEANGSSYDLYLKQSSTQVISESISETDFTGALKRVAHEVKKYTVSNKLTLTAICVRIVAPGTLFQKHTVVDDGYLSHLRDKELMAPLHIPHIIREIKGCHEWFPDTKIIAVSDSAFHASLPFVAREFSLQREESAALDIHRFGYHGLSVASVAHRIHTVTGSDSARMIVCHIGNGVSITALKNGISVETSMGYSPVSGVAMGSRSGDLDPGALIEIMRVKNLRPSEATVYINSSGGLRGLCGDTDIRRLLDRRAHGDVAAKNALDFFLYQIQKFIAASTVSLGGVDTIVFTGTAGVRSAELRSLIVKNISYFGIEIDEEKNDNHVGKEGVISKKNSVVKVVVMRTDEMGEMARVAQHFT